MSEGTSDADKENASPSSVQRRNTTTFMLPPRRERTRAKMRKEQTQQQMQRAASNIKARVKSGKDDKYTVDDAVNIYITDFIRSKSRIDGSEGSPLASPDREKTVYDSYIDPMRYVPPWHRKEYVLTERESKKYKQINGVYGHQDKRVEQRQAHFLQKLEDIQIEKWRRRHEEYYHKQVKAAETKNKQQQQLKHLRDKFEQEQVRRFQTQYVTSRILEHEWSNRHLYGLPEDIGDEPKYNSKLKRKKQQPKETFDTMKQRERNKKMYQKLFSHRFPEYYHNSKPPKMEGIDLNGNGRGEKLALNWSPRYCLNFMIF